ncbi:MAG TPA: ribbon-helix-helix protein, CopG family [Planctomycetota bacterium]|nr:ribbon-helix-helix protein, CopG family [Planctomycetota bacterium]
MERNGTVLLAKKKDKLVTIRLDGDSAARLDALHAKWEVSKGEVLRRLLKMLS